MNAQREPESAEPPAPRNPEAQIPKDEFNQIAMMLNAPIFWREDTNKDGIIEAGETQRLLFYPDAPTWSQGKVFTDEFTNLSKRMYDWREGKRLPQGLDDDETKRRELIIQELAQSMPTLVFNDLTALELPEKKFVGHMMVVGELIDNLYATQTGAAALRKEIPKDDPTSASAFRRNWGPKCVSPATENIPECSSVPGAPKPIYDVYPASIQKEQGFCDLLTKNEKADELMSPFVVVREKEGKLIPVPYNEAYKGIMGIIAKELDNAAKALEGRNEAALQAYLKAAAEGFRTNNWVEADEAWSKMNATNSKWYLRVGPDETYWEPCSRKAGFHMAFALINPDSLKWQEKLNPVQQEMEDSLAKVVGAPYQARPVTFHLPDFIDIVFNNGDSRHYLGAVVGQSLPNWGPVANEGRGRTVVMSNLYTDPDSRTISLKQAQSLFDKSSLEFYPKDAEAGLLSIILHEATHNFGPAHEYRFEGKKDTEFFGGPLASTMEELKAQTGALWYLDFLRNKGIISDEMVNQTYQSSIQWAMGHIARGMYSDTGKPKPYSHVSVIQLGFLMKEGAITFDPEMAAPNGTDKGVFILHFDKFPEAVNKLMVRVGHIKAVGDKDDALELRKEFVNSDLVPQTVIQERVLRAPKATFVYAIEI